MIEVGEHYKVDKKSKTIFINRFTLEVTAITDNIVTYEYLGYHGHLYEFYQPCANFNEAIEAGSITKVTLC